MQAPRHAATRPRGAPRRRVHGPVRLTAFMDRYGPPV